MPTIELTKGQVAIVDPEDMELAEFNWYASSHARFGRFYAVRFVGRKCLLLHRVIAERAGFDITGLMVDHINRDGLDCRRGNLRPCSRRQNLWNTYHHGDESRTKGVSFHARDKRWRAFFKGSDGKQVHLGYFGSKAEAALAYDAAVLQVRGEFSRGHDGRLLVPATSLRSGEAE
jgi:hypothetical protein